MPKKKRPSKRFGLPPQEPQLPDDLTDAAKYEAVHKVLLDLNPTEVKEMSAWLKLRIDDAKNSKVWRTTKENIVKYRAAYEDGVARTSTGMTGAHDYRTKLAAAQTDGLVSRLLNIFSVDPLLKFEGRNPQGLQNAFNVEKFVDHHHDVNVRLSSRGDEISSTLGVEGHVVLYSPWILEIIKDKPTLVQKQTYQDGSGKSFPIDMMDKVAVSKAKALGLVPKQPEAFVVTEEKKTTVTKNFPDLKVESLMNYLCPPDAKPGKGKGPSWEAIRVPFSLDELEKLNEDKQMYSGTLKDIKNYLAKKPIEAEEPKSSSRGEDTVMDGSTAPLDKDALDSVLFCWVVWGKQKVPGKKGLQDVVTLYNEESGRVLQTRLNGNIDTRPPFFHLRLLMLPWRFAGMGVMEMAYDGERAVNDLSNVILDEGQIFASLPYKYNKKKFPGGIPPFEFWKGLGVSNMKDLEAMNFNDRRPMDMNVASFIRANTERRTGQGDLQLGRESDITGKQPPTARGIATILQEGQVRYTKVNFGVIYELCDYGQFIVKLFQQYMASNTPVEVLGEDKSEVFPDGLSRYQIMGSYVVTANMAAQQMARDLDAQLNIQLLELFVQTQNPFIMKSLSSYYTMTEDVLKSVGKKKMWMKPLSFYQNDGQTPGAQATAGMGLTPQEQQFAEMMIKQGVPPEEVKALIMKNRTGAGQGEMSEQDMASEQQLLTGGQGAVPMEAA